MPDQTNGFNCRLNEGPYKHYKFQGAMDTSEVFFFLTGPPQNVYSTKTKAMNKHYGFGYFSKRGRKHKGWDYEEYLKQGLMTTKSCGGGAMAAYLQVHDEYKATLEFNNFKNWGDAINWFQDPSNWNPGMKDYNLYGKAKGFL